MAFFSKGMSLNEHDMVIIPQTACGIPAPNACALHAVRLHTAIGAAQGHSLDPSPYLSRLLFCVAAFRAEVDPFSANHLQRTIRVTADPPARADERARSSRPALPLGPAASRRHAAAYLQQGALSYSHTFGPHEFKRKEIVIF